MSTQVGFIGRCRENEDDHEDHAWCQEKPKGAKVTVSVVVGNPKPRSHTYQTALLVAERLAGRAPDLVVDLADVASALVGPVSPEVGALVSEVQASSLFICATPTYKGSPLVAPWTEALR